MFGILASGTALKLALFFYCNWLKACSDSMGALAEDHLNDVASNLGAILAAGVTKAWPAGWWVDSVSAILIALVILGRWSHITHAQVGGGAPGWGGGLLGRRRRWEGPGRVGVRAGQRGSSEDAAVPSSWLHRRGRGAGQEGGRERTAEGLLRGAPWHPCAPFSSCLASTAQHSTAQHSTAQHSTAQPVGPPACLSNRTPGPPRPPPPPPPARARHRF